MKNKQAFEFLTVSVEQDEHSAAVEGIGLLIAREAASSQSYVKLERTFNQSDFQGGYIKFWRIKSSWHPSFNSDLSLEGLKSLGIVRWF